MKLKTERSLSWTLFAVSMTCVVCSGFGDVYGGLTASNAPSEITGQVWQAYYGSGLRYVDEFFLVIHWLLIPSLLLLLGSVVWVGRVRRKAK